MNAPFKPSSSSTREPFSAYVCDQDTLDVLQAVVTDLGWAAERCYKGGLRNAVQSLSITASPSILLVDLSESSDPIHDINGLAEVCEPGTVVIATGQVNDVRLYRDLVASGIQDYLLKPLFPDQLRDAIAHAQMTLTAPRTAEAAGPVTHTLVGVMGARGGCGASMIATSLAYIFSDQGDRQTALLDLDVHFGTGALSLDLEPGRGLIDAIDNPSRIDGLFIERAMVRANPKLALLSAEAPMNQPVMSDGTAFHLLAQEINHAFETTIVDLPRNMAINHPHLVNDAQAIVVVTELTLAAARDTIRVLAWIRANAPSAKVFLVANKMQSTVEISRKEFEGSVEREIDFVINYDPKIAIKAAKLGKSFAEVAKGSKAAQPLVQLMRAINAVGEASDGDANGEASAKSDKSGGKAAAKSGGSLMSKFNVSGMLSKKK